MRFVTLYKTWWLTLLFAYLSSFVWLGAVIVCVPAVVALAPLGITSLFHPPPYAAAARAELGPLEYGLHILFWSLFIVGAFACKSLPPKVVTAIYTTILIFLILTIAGCSRYYHLAGLKVT